MARHTPLYAVAAFYAEPEDLLDAARGAQARKFGQVEAYSPAPVPGLAAVLGANGDSTRIAGMVGAILGAAGFFTMAAYATTISYVFLIGGRPAFSWASYVIPSVSVGGLVGGVAATAALLFRCRLPRLNHPAFNIEGFERVSSDRYVLTVEPVDDSFDPARVERFLGSLAGPPLLTERVPR